MILPLDIATFFGFIRDMFQSMPLVVQALIWFAFFYVTVIAFVRSL